MVQVEELICGHCASKTIVAIPIFIEVRMGLTGIPSIAYTIN
jgi:hypothetical protein